MHTLTLIFVDDSLPKLGRHTRPTFNLKDYVAGTTGGEKWRRVRGIGEAEERIEKGKIYGWAGEGKLSGKRGVSES